MDKKTYTYMSVNVHCTDYITENDNDIICVSEYVKGSKYTKDYITVTINDVTFFMTPAQYETLKEKIVKLKK